MNRGKSRTVSVFAIRNLKFLGFVLRKNGKEIYVRVHTKLKVCVRGRLNYYGITEMKNPIEDINSWLHHRIRM